MSGLTFGRWSIEGGALLRWDLSGPKGLVRFEVADALGFTSAAVYLHEYVAPVGGELEECPVCGKCWCNAMSGDIARALRGAWERTGCDDDVIRTNLERWYHEELSTPVPVSEGSQVSGEEVGPATNGPNLAATGAAEVAAFGAPVPVAAPHEHDPIECACELTPEDAPGHPARRVPPVPVVAQPRYILNKDAILELVKRYGDVRVVAATGYSTRDELAADDVGADLLDAIRGALTPVPDVEPGLRWGSGPLVDHNLETPAGAKPREPVAGSPTAAGAREADPASLGLGAGSAAPDGLRTQREMDADLYENWVTNQEAGTGSADPDGGQR